MIPNKIVIILLAASRGFITILIPLVFTTVAFSQPGYKYDLVFNKIPVRWDEGLPLGNGLLGAMIWQNGNNLRFSLDRADVWDLRKISEFELDEWNFSWVYQRWLQPKEYMTVQQLFDTPYERDAAPTKIPVAALEFPLDGLGAVEYSHLDIKNAVCEIKWKNGVKLETFVHATDAVGCFRFTGLKDEFSPELLVPDFAAKANSKQAGKGLYSLDYPVPVITRGKNSILIHQDTYGGAYYEVKTVWSLHNGELIGAWSICVYYPGDASKPDVSNNIDSYLRKGQEDGFTQHRNWWKKYWDQSNILVPDSIIQKQYYQEIYKMGCISRKGAPAASLQAIWTSDNGNLPPWKNDYHNDLNTQMTYWPCYTSNHLAESSVFTDWMWNYKTVAEKYTRKYFGAEGLNFPGVAALNAYPLGGWIQYAFSSTTSAWLSQHFYWQWKYSLDRKFLENRAYPWIKDAGTFIENISVILPDSSRYLLMSSSPELNENSEKAWFKRNTNFDVSLIQNLYSEAIEMADVLGLPEDKARWTKNLSQWGRIALDPIDSSLMVAADYPLEYSHRHFSHLVSVYPLGQLDCDKSEAEKNIVLNSLKHIDELGTKAWCGYSFAWYALLKARAGDGNAALDALKIFVSGFTLPNSFHVNGDQTNKGYSDDHSRVITLEGNMGFAAAIQEMMLQSYQGVLRIFPAVPDSWSNASFINLRAEGAFVVTGVRDKGQTKKVMVISEKGGILKLLNPFKSGTVVISGTKDYTADGKILVISTRPGQIITFETQ